MPSSSSTRRQASIEQILGIKPPEVPHVPVVDLFASCGGFSCGAEQAGHRVVLAIDCDQRALDCHQANHPHAAHHCIMLGPDTEERVMEIVRRHVPRDGPWHLHGSPPCTLFSNMRNVTHGLDYEQGMEHVHWYIQFVKRVLAEYTECSPTWSFEQVPKEPVVEYLREQEVEHACIDFSEYGVPQTRKRMIAGTDYLVRRLRDNCTLKVERKATPRDVLTTIPSNATLVRASGGKCIPKFYRSVDVPTWTLLTACKPVFATSERECIRVFTIKEIERLQTFPAGYLKVPHMCTSGEAVKFIGNAVPPLMAKLLLGGLRSDTPSLPAAPRTRPVQPPSPMRTTRPLSPSLQRNAGPLTKKQKPGTIEGMFGKAPVRTPVVCERAQRSDEPVRGKRVVDLFCGLGGFSQGAVDAGHTVVLAVDNWKEALGAHRRNHPRTAHACMSLGPDTEEDLVTLIRKHVPEGCEWHLHGSPPCQKLSKMAAVKVGMAVDAGMEMVCWYLKLVLRLKPTTWSFEQVNIGELRGLMQFAKFLYPDTLSYDVVHMDEYGVPQSRRRMIAGSPCLMHALRTDTSLRAPAPVVTDVLKPPSNAVYMRSSVGMTPTAERQERHGDVRPVASLCWTCTATHPHAWLTVDRAHIREFTNEEQMLLQTFHKKTKLPERRQDAVRAIGNAIPPLFVSKLLKQAAPADGA
jgi:DNA (cytosine-5)-methyltransferase 1